MPQFSSLVFLFLVSITHISHLPQVLLEYHIHICGEMEKIKTCYLSQCYFNLVNIFGFCTFVDELYLSFIYTQSPFQGQKSLQKSNEPTVIKTHWQDFKWYQHFKDVMVLGDVLLRKGDIYNPVFLSIVSGSEQEQKEILTDCM